MGPIVAESWQHMTQDVTFGDCPVNVRDHNLGCMIQEVDFTGHLLGSLHPAGYCERDFIRTIMQVQALQLRLRR